jgi:uncharacterized protein YbgA (DUF1722 family)
MAHSPRDYAGLGRLVAGAQLRARADLEAQYEAAFMRALSVVTTPRRHANVLRHILGYFKKTLDAHARAEILSLIDEHQGGRVPLAVPLRLMRDHVKRHNVAYLQGQTYLAPYPSELILGNQ